MESYVKSLVQRVRKSNNKVPTEGPGVKSTYNVHYNLTEAEVRELRAGREKRLAKFEAEQARQAAEDEPSGYRRSQTTTDGRQTEQPSASRPKELARRDSSYSACSRSSTTSMRRTRSSKSFNSPKAGTYCRIKPLLKRFGVEEMGDIILPKCEGYLGKRVRQFNLGEKRKDKYDLCEPCLTSMIKVQQEAIKQANAEQNGNVRRLAAAESRIVDEQRYSTLLWMLPLFLLALVLHRLCRRFVTPKKPLIPLYENAEGDATSPDASTESD